MAFLNYSPNEVLIVDGEPLNFEEVRYSGGIKTLKNPVNVS
jgi:hypothetical protein